MILFPEEEPLIIKLQDDGGKLHEFLSKLGKPSGEKFDWQTDELVPFSQEHPT